MHTSPVVSVYEAFESAATVCGQNQTSGALVAAKWAQIGPMVAAHGGRNMVAAKLHFSLQSKQQFTNTIY